ncbi:hypothetical protein ITJ86_03220 [Winogradskyella sp. F6397]|uniref:Haem-binding uptake Tiki superfamily ChaN domain-containing protein n=1 Tax=Winogradskyella marina TaxID=2785530 RepID=A0ABS0EFE0_9FLAO|nr:hypothetical protein [Winogradskyella marina]MBF8148891.1 hypothetical protein [Winogradskyella marina]
MTNTNFNPIAMYLRLFIGFIFILSTSLVVGQVTIENQHYFDSFFKNEKGKNLLLLGENHSSSVASTIYPELIKSLYENKGLRTLFIEFGPAEAYFYNKYLESGDEKYLAYTIYGGFYTSWKEAWKEIYAFNSTKEVPLKVVGVDFDRTRTFGYSLYNILKPHKEKGLPKSIDSLLSVIKDQSFFKTYTIGHPSEEGKAFVKSTKELLKKQKTELFGLLKKEDGEVLSQLMLNRAEGYGGTREEDIKQNIVQYLNSSEERNFLMLVGRDHLYYKPLYDDNPRMAKLLKEETSLNLISGVILHEDSGQWGDNYEEEIILNEVQNKTPWKDFYSILKDQMNSDFTIIELTNQLEALSIYMDYILVAKNQPAIKI